MKDYTPVSCDVIDRIEILATNKRKVSVIIIDENTTYNLSGIFETWFTKNKVEFLKFKGGIYIRLDKIFQIQDILVNDTSC
jgi:transcriptional antiterminator Rof (Rho-off)